MADHVTIGEMVADARSRIRNLSVEEVAQALDTDDAMLVDIREANELAETGTIPGAEHAPRGMLEFWADPSSPKYQDRFKQDRPIILYCATGGRSALAADVLQRLGYQNVAHLDTGITGWLAAGKPTTS